MKQKSPDNRVDKPFVKYIIRNSCVALATLGGALYLLRGRLPERFFEGFVYGAVCGILNLYLLSVLIRSALNPTGAKKLMAAASLAGINGLIYFYFYAFWKLKFNHAALVAGFSLVFAVMAVGAAFQGARKGFLPDERT